MYLEILVNGNPVNCLLDTGSEATLIPRSLVQKLPKKPVTSQIRAANGTTIEVLGLVSLPVVLREQELLVSGVASDHIGELLLGIDWLEEQQAIWDMRRGELYMHGSLFPLKAKQDGGWVRRIVVQEAVQLPTRSETNVIGRTVYRDLADAWDTWASKPGSPSDELRVARTVVPNRCKNVPMRVMNVTGYPVTLPVGAVLIDLEAVEMVGDQPESASVGDEGRDSGAIRDLRASVYCWTESIPRYPPRFEKL